MKLRDLEIVLVGSMIVKALADKKELTGAAVYFDHHLLRTDQRYGWFAIGLLEDGTSIGNSIDVGVKGWAYGSNWVEGDYGLDRFLTPKEIEEATNNMNWRLVNHMDQPFDWEEFEQAHINIGAGDNPNIAYYKEQANEKT